MATTKGTDIGPFELWHLAVRGMPYKLAKKRLMQAGFNDKEAEQKLKDFGINKDGTLDKEKHDFK